MPSEKILEQKKQLIAELSERIKASKAGVLVNYCGISVDDDTKLRKELREAGVHYTVTKNTYLKLAFDGLELSGLDHVLEGNTALATSAEDELVAAKILCDYADKNDNFEIKAGFSEGKALDADTIKALAKVPPKDALLGMLAGALSQTIAGLARAINAVAEKQQGDAPAEA